LTSTLLVARLPVDAKRYPAMLAPELFRLVASAVNSGLPLPSSPKLDKPAPNSPAVSG